MQNVTDKKQGFTLIEVVLVLAIAGLIFLIVFLALPALQRSQRDTQRKQDISRFMSQVTNYTSNNQGSLPGGASPTSADWNTFVSNYLTNSNQTFNDPNTGATYSVTYTGTIPATAPTMTAGNITVYPSARCGGGWGVSAITPTANRSFAAIIYQEQGNFYCQNN